jgi:hypothetical protein
VVGGSPRAQPARPNLLELHSLGIDVALHQQGIDTTTSVGKAMLLRRFFGASFD